MRDNTRTLTTASNQPTMTDRLDPMNHAAGTQLVSSFRYQVARFAVTVATGAEAGRTTESAGHEVTIGTDPRCGLQVSDPTVSSMHCAITATPEGINLSDLGSTNGVVIAGCRVTHALLAPGTHIFLGNTEIIVERLAEDATEPISRESRFGPLLGSSLAMRRLFAILPRIANSQATILVEGETGTGKSLLARAIHEASPRADGPFVVVDCSAIPPTLIESELFGHEKGAFTGANDQRAGYFEAAMGGTVFLDEIAELPLELQSRLLRVIEERVVYRVGSRVATSVDIRIIAATNRDVRSEVNSGTFRADLWYRLATVKLRLPPLRERKEDIPRLVEHIWASLSGSEEPAPVELISSLSHQRWPGNVRELRSAIERALLFGNDARMWEGAASTLPDESEAAVALSFREAKALAIDAWERDYLAELLERHRGNISAAARSVSMNRNHLRDLLVRHGIRDG